MRLDLTAEERHAKEQVKLPWQHTGEGSQYKRFDMNEYLPQAAGGQAPGANLEGQGKLGHIMYVRDSDSDHDSDEDPDDDLDI